MSHARLDSPLLKSDSDVNQKPLLSVFNTFRMNVEKYKSVQWTKKERKSYFEANQRYNYTAWFPAQICTLSVSSIDKSAIIASCVKMFQLTNSRRDSNMILFQRYQGLFMKTENRGRLTSYFPHRLHATLPSQQCQ